MACYIKFECNIILIKMQESSPFMTSILNYTVNNVLTTDEIRKDLNENIELYEERIRSKKQKIKRLHVLFNNNVNNDIKTRYYNMIVDAQKDVVTYTQIIYEFNVLMVKYTT